MKRGLTCVFLLGYNARILLLKLSTSTQRRVKRPKLGGRGQELLDLVSPILERVTWMGPSFELGFPVWKAPASHPYHGTSQFAHLSSDREPCLGSWRVSSRRPLSWQN